MNCYNAGVVKLHAVPQPDYGIAGQPNLGIFLPGKKLAGSTLSQQFGKKHTCKSFYMKTKTYGNLKSMVR